MAGELLAQIKNDLNSMIEQGEFSEPIIIQNNDKSITLNTNGIYDETFEEIDPDTGAVTFSSYSRVRIDENKVKFIFGSNVNDDIESAWFVTARAVEYKVFKRIPMGDGDTILVLTK